MRVPTLFKILTFAILLSVGAASVPAQIPSGTPAQRMAVTVMQQWPAGVITTTKNPGVWSYEEGVLLDGLAAEWHATGNGAYFAYIQAAVDRYIVEDGAGNVSITGLKPESHTLDDVEMGRAVLLVYRVTLQSKYAKAAKALHDQLIQQPRTASGGYWHKQIYPNQMWLDGAYMAEPFRAEYAATFHTPEDFDDIAKQLLLMDQHMRDAKSGLLKHGWDESKTMPWADKETGLSPEVWARAMGWYGMALVDVLDWFPKEHPQHGALLAALSRTISGVIGTQDPTTGVWWQVMDRGALMPVYQAHSGPIMKSEIEQPLPGNFPEASASCMFTYVLAKAARLGYTLPSTIGNAGTGWTGIQKQFVTANGDGTLMLRGTVKVGGLGGTPYRSGTYDYYIHEPTGDQDSKGVGAFLLAGSEMEQTQIPSGNDKEKGSGKTVLLDAFFSAQTRKNPLGGTDLFHYKWDDDSNSGYSFFGYAFQRFGARLAELPTAPTAATLAGASVYILVSPDIPSKNPHPNYLDKASDDAIEAWVRAGGVLLLFSNDRDNTEFTHFNELTDRFGLHFNAVLSHHVVEPDHGPGEVVIPAGTGIFGAGFTAYMKDTSTITPTGPAKALVTDHGDVMIAVSHLGKGSVLAVTDPWFYNEYADGRKMRQYEGYEAAIDIARWAVARAK